MHPLRIYQPCRDELAIFWQGGTESRISTRDLRLNCPCTACTSAARSRSATYIPLLPQAATTIRELTLIGSHSLQVTWEDGHSWGIYPYGYLRQIAPPKEPAPEGTTA